MARLLIVDDETPLCELLQRYLVRQGYDVDIAAHPEAAWARFESDPLRYDLVITDLRFEGGDGEELIERMRTKAPRLRAILSSGYPHQPNLAGVQFLQKPFLPAVLVEAVQRALG